MIDKAIEEIDLTKEFEKLGEAAAKAANTVTPFKVLFEKYQSLLDEERQRNDKLVELVNNINDEIIEWDLDGAKDENNLPSMIYDWSDKITELAIEQKTNGTGEDNNTREE